METKTIEQIKDEVAKENGSKNWNALILASLGKVSFNLEDLRNVVTLRYAEQYAYQKCEEQIKACNANVELDILCQHGYGVISEGSILNTPNVCNPKT